MQAIILAAGMGRRLGDLTANNTKCMISVNNEKLIDRMMDHLLSLSLSRIIIVIGYEGDKLKNYLKSRYPGENIMFVENSKYDKTNNIYSLWLTRSLFQEDDTLLLESDIIFENELLDELLSYPYPDCALVSKYERWMDGTMVKIDGDNNIVNFINKKAFCYSDIDNYYKTVNIYKLSRSFINSQYIPFLEAYIKSIGENEYYEQVLSLLVLVGNIRIKGVPVDANGWYEIDDIQDLHIAETMFADPECRLYNLNHSYGGYWRYQCLLDFCYLVNPYFPPERMVDEIGSNFGTLLRQYPSGMGVNSMLASKYFNVKSDYIAVGNGAAELIKVLVENLRGKIGVIYPTFEEYPNRIDKEKLVIYETSYPDFRYTSDDIISYFSEHEVDNLIVINPDNPSGNILSWQELNKLAGWSGERGIKLVIDESFVDFSTVDKNMSLLKNDILEKYPCLYVVKSISKSYGVPGLRLGVIASSDRSMISNIRKEVSIWNINSFAEYYMQIFGKYEDSYRLACDKFKEERDRFENILKLVPYLRVLPSQANYFLCEVTDRFTAHELAVLLLKDHNILIKDCSGKRGFPHDKEFIRIAVRDKRDNKALVTALLSYL